MFKLRYFTKIFQFATLPLMAVVGCAPHCDSPSACPPLVIIPKPKIISVNEKGESVTYPVLRFGKFEAQPILILHPAPGSTPQTIEFSKTVADWGYNVYLPNLYPKSGIEFGANDFRKAKKYFRSSPIWATQSYRDIGSIIDHIEQLAKHIYKETGKKPIVIGNCLTGIIPLALIGTDHVDIGILCQPASPEVSNIEVLFGFHLPWKSRVLGISQGRFQKSLSAMKMNPAKQLLGFHYSNDPLAPMARFNTLQELFLEAGVTKQFTTFVCA